jgi:hypothetical protein
VQVLLLLALAAETACVQAWPASCDDDRMTDRWAWIDEHILHHQILRAVTALRDRPGPQQASHGSVLRWRGLAVVEILVGLLLVLIALGVFLSQGSQIRVTARVLSRSCHLQPDLGTGQVDTRCDAQVQFTAVNGQVIRTEITDAFRSEFSGSGRSQTIALRYDRGDPSQPFKQSNYMPVGEFILLLVIGTGALTLGCWMYARAQWVADRVAAGKASARGSLIYQWASTSTPSPTSDPDEPPPLPADLI